jgi:hypothetical protein
VIQVCSERGTLPSVNSSAPPVFPSPSPSPSPFRLVHPLSSPSTLEEGRELPNFALNWSPLEAVLFLDSNRWMAVLRYEGR